MGAALGAALGEVEAMVVEVQVEDMVETLEAGDIDSFKVCILCFYSPFELSPN